MLYFQSEKKCIINIALLDFMEIKTDFLKYHVMPPVWRHSIFLEYLWCREYGLFDTDLDFHKKFEQWL